MLLPGINLKRYISVTLFTGIRQGEALGLCWDSINFDSGTILINKQLLKDKNNGQYYLTSIKNDKYRNITPAPFVMAALRNEKQRQEESRLMVGDENWNNPDNLVFTNELGEHLKHVTVYKNFKKIVRELGLDDIRFHDLRHTYAVTSLQSGDDVKTVQENLGHHTAAFTLDIYGHVSERMKQESANRMEQFINGIRKGKETAAALAGN
jgi:integrase